MSDRLLALADELYSLPLVEFTARRDAIVREVKAERELAARVKALKKPTVAAWVVNLLVRRDAEQVTQMLEVGTALREAQAGMSAEDLRALTRQRRQLTAAVTTQARRLARGEGHSVTAPVADQVEATLTAAMLDEGAAAAVRSGLLVTALRATGVEAVDAATAVALPEALGHVATAVASPAAPDADGGPPALHVVPDPEADSKARRAAEDHLTEAEQAHRDAASALAEATADVERLEARSLQLQAEVEEVRGRLAELESQQEEHDDELADAEDVRSEAAEAATRTDQDLADARDALDRLP